ncbi:MAG: ACP S-malonyltransferase [Pseudomonadota bacterium]
MKTFMFPGQGSQARGMGGDLFDQFKDVTEKADNILGYSIKELCLTDPRRELNKTRFTQPALFVVNALCYLKKVEETGQTPDYVAGHSLGEFNALLAAECFDFEAGLKLVKKRGELMSKAPEGGMAAILNASKEEIEDILKKNGLTNIDLANYNTPSQIVISGPLEEIGKAQEFFQQGAMLYYPLNTSGAFHSRIMQPVKEKFEIYLKKFKFAAPKIPVISNVTARPYGSDDVVENLSTQLASGVRWSDSIQYLMAVATDEMEFEEVGNGEVMTKIFKTIKMETAKALENSPAQESSNGTKSADAGAASQDQHVASNAQSSAKAQAATKAQQDTAKPAAATKQDSLPKPTSFAAAEDKVKAWNIKYPVGTKVKSAIADYKNLETRTAAIVLFGHRAAVYMKEYNGYFDLEEVTPV